MQFELNLPPKYLRIGLPILLLLVGGFIGWFSAMMIYAQHDDNGQLLETHTNTGDGLTNPLLWCDQPNNQVASTIIPFRPIIERTIQKLQATPEVDEISYYFRELNTGYWIALEENEKFIPASLLKLPLLMTLYKQAQADPTIWNEKLFYPPKASSIPQNYPADTEGFVDGQQYSVKELTTRMITQSDNQSLDALGTIISNEPLDELMRLIGAPMPSVDEDFITVRQYATLFRLLYNASYVPQQNSEEILKLLAQTHFNKGIVAPLPTNITIAHKFGERKIAETNQLQLHDCGIVYYPQHPYILCIMTRGASFEALEKTIQQLSAITYSSMEEYTLSTVE